MEFLRSRDRNYLKRLSATFLHTPGIARLGEAISLPSIRISAEEEGSGVETARDLQLQKQRIEAKFDVITTTETLAYSARKNKYNPVTIPLSVKNQVTETPGSSMARPRSPQRKNEVDHEYLQGMLDEQISVIRQQLNCLSSERAKMEQKMEDLTNGIKEAHELSARVPRFVITSSTPGSIRRAHSVEARRSHVIKTDSQLSLQRKAAAAAAAAMAQSPPLDEVDGGHHRSSSKSYYSREQFASISSLGSLKDSDIVSPSDSVITSSINSSSESGSTRFRFFPADDNPAPTPIPELPESPTIPRPVSPYIYATYSPRCRPRTGSSSIPSSLKLSSSPNHQRMHSQPSPSQLSRAHTLLSPPMGLPTSTPTRQRSGSFSLLASPRLALKATNSSQDLRNRSNSSSLSPAPKKKSPSSKLRRSQNKDQRLSYFRKNSFTDLESTLKGSQLSITDDECELKGSVDSLSQLSGSTFEHDMVGLTPKKTGSSSRILRRSSLTGQIEHVTNPKSNLRRNSSFNTSPSMEKAKHASIFERRSLSVNKATSPRSTNQTQNGDSSRIFLNSKETTV